MADGIPGDVRYRRVLQMALTIMMTDSQAKGGHYQLACGVAFEGQHGGCACDAGINHPHQVCTLRLLPDFEE